jgi:hypothetical protein
VKRMDIDALHGRVDIERIYRHVLALEGLRHPLDAPDRLKWAAGYIRSELERYGVPVRLQEFYVDGFDDVFYNVEGWLGDEALPAAALMNHYDTNEHTTGANDNAAGVAVMLECARLLAEAKETPPVRFLSFSLEEGNPAIQSRIRRSARDLGLLDEQYRTTSFGVAKLLREHAQLTHQEWQFGYAGRNFSESLAAATAQMRERIAGDHKGAALLQHLMEQERIWAGVTFWPGQYGHLGAWAWVEEARSLEKPIEFGLCLDEIGTTSKREGSQTLPKELSWDLLQTYCVDRERMIGDWAFVITNGAAERVGRAFVDHCQRETICLPYAYLHLPFGWDGITQHFPQAIGSDYSAFWHAGIPALFLFDTAGWRNPYGHSMADTLDRLDFEQIGRICQACLCTLVDPALR